MAISAPTNWTTAEPLLAVETEVDPIVEDLKKSILVKNNDELNARWHFFIGSPGNGKSAAIGKLCKKLISEYSCEICDEDGTKIQDLEPNEIPYALYVGEKDNNYTSCIIVQDASVVRDPFAPVVDPAKELLEAVKSSWEKGISLIVCTNRGVLEKLHRDYFMNQSINSQDWFKIITNVLANNESTAGELSSRYPFNSKKTVFQTVSVGYCYLDTRSLLLGRNTFKLLINKATNSEKWESCNECELNEICPFYLNRCWLNDEPSLDAVLGLLSRAEVLSGQVIVFREALAIISFLLAGCPQDYDEFHPCEWVSEKKVKNNIFALSSRRIYMSLFASFSPRGLEVDSTLRGMQMDALMELRNNTKEDDLAIIACLDAILKEAPPSADVGVERLLGESGILASIDPCTVALPSEFYGEWDADYEAIRTYENPFFSMLEHECLNVWKSLEERLEQLSDHFTTEAYWALHRWSSNYLLHFGALLTGLTAWSNELKEFSYYLELMEKSPADRNQSERREIRQLDAQLEKMINNVGDDESISSLQLSDSVALAGEWVRDNLKPKTIKRRSSGSITLSIDFSGGEQAVFTAMMYLWLSMRARGKLDLRCLPIDLLQGVNDARTRAAAKGNYAFVSDVDLVVTDEKGDSYMVSRYESDVDIERVSNVLSPN